MRPAGANLESPGPPLHHRLDMGGRARPSGPMSYGREIAWGRFSFRFSSLHWIFLLIGAGFVLEFLVAGSGAARRQGGPLELLQPELPAMWATGCNGAAAFFVEYEWWRLFAAIFLHGGALHILMNAFALHDLGRIADRIFGPGRLLLAFLATGVAASLVSVAWKFHFSGGRGLSLGASGAICGLLGLLLRHFQNRSDLAAQSMARGLLRSAILLLFIGIAVPMIDNAAHVGGFAAGYALGFVLRPAAFDGMGPTRERRWTLIAAWVLGLATAAALAVAWGGARDRFEEFGGLYDIQMPILQWTENPTDAHRDSLLSKVRDLDDRGSIGEWRSRLLAVAGRGSRDEVLRLFAEIKGRLNRLGPDMLLPGGR